MTYTIGASQTEFGFTGEQYDAYIKLIYLRSRMYDPASGRFITKDSWQGDYNRPLSLNRWNYVKGNPVNYTDPSGLWRIAPGFDLSNGGIYGQGQLTAPGGVLCSGTCWTTPTTTVPIFVPQKRNGILYNDVILEIPRCDAWELALPTNTNDWKVIFTKSGNSQAFSQGGFVDLSIAAAVGMGYDSGFLPLGIQFDPSSYYGVNASIAFQLFMAQSQAERENFNLVEVFDNANLDVFEARVSGVVFLANALQGVQAFNSRAYTITIQEHKSVHSFRRAIIETSSAYMNVQTHEILIPSSFLSFENGSWKEHGFNLARSH